MIDLAWKAFKKELTVSAMAQFSNIFLVAWEVWVDLEVYSEEWEEGEGSREREKILYTNWSKISNTKFPFNIEFVSFRVSLEDLYNGKTSKLQLSRNVLCKKCNG